MIWLWLAMAIVIPLHGRGVAPGGVNTFICGLQPGTYQVWSSVPDSTGWEVWYSPDGDTLRTESGGLLLKSRAGISYRLEKTR